MGKSLIVALSEARVEPEFDTIRYLPSKGRWTEKLAHLGREIEGELALMGYRMYQAGYMQCIKDGRRRKAAFAMQPQRAEQKRR